MDIRERILVFLEFKRLNRNQFYKMTGLSNGYLDKKGGISSDAFEKIRTAFPELSLDWLVSGKAPMLRLPDRPETGGRIAAELLQSSTKLTDLLRSINDQLAQLSTEMNNFEADIRSFRQAVGVRQYDDTFSKLTSDDVLAAEKPQPRLREKKK